jgi:hypothetical protein
MSQLEVTQAKIDAARQAKGRKGIGSTIVAGQQPLGGAANGGGGNTLLNQAAGQKNTLLGGG